ncbi:MAG: YdcF family protein [Myxococcales bacterium]|nr:MAG: YdcF family protein [Myxococcales bacterium]
MLTLLIDDPTALEIIRMEAILVLDVVVLARVQDLLGRQLHAAVEPVGRLELGDAAVVERRDALDEAEVDDLESARGEGREGFCHAGKAIRARNESMVDSRPDDVALVLGCAVLPSRPSTMLAARCATAARLWQSGRVRRLLLSGTPLEARAMIALVTSLGVPASALLVDDGARRTLDNVWRARHRFGLDAVVLVTSDFHLPRALLLARLVGLRAVGVPSDLRTARAVPWLREAAAWSLVPRDAWRQRRGR